MGTGASTESSQHFVTLQVSTWVKGTNGLYEYTNPKIQQEVVTSTHKLTQTCAVNMDAQSVVTVGDSTDG